MMEEIIEPLFEEMEWYLCSSDDENRMRFS